MKTSTFRSSRRRAAFTLLQLGLVIGLLGVLSALILPVFSRAKAGAERQNCDVKLKTIALALDAFKSERGTYPTSLQKLRTDGYLTEAGALHCSRDPRPDGTYNDGYVLRAPGDAGELPVVTCPFHEDRLGGNQARLGRFTTEFATKPAVLTSGNAVQIQRAGQSDSIPGYAGMPLHGGDEIKVSERGTALVTFADDSTARLQSGTDITVLQSFMDGQSGAPLYTLVRQTLGDATYTVHHGSRFDVATPAATAGARGTQFQVKVSGPLAADTQLYVIEGKVVLTTPARSGVAPVGRSLSAILADVINLPRFGL